MDTLMKVVPDTVADSNYEHVPVLGIQTKKVQWVLICT